MVQAIHSKTRTRWTTDHCVGDPMTTIHKPATTLFTIASDHLKYVVAYLMDGVAIHWESIGLFLGIPYKYIELFKLEDSLEDSVAKMVEAWLARKHDVGTFGEPTWRKLVEAVASRSGGGNQRLAANICKDHPLSYTSESTWVGVGSDDCCVVMLRSCC